ncbi:ABC transporter ATP-binding protein [Pontibacter fetidus]|uniref:ABC transporter ATP-binding protein n=1 Tax=Pontibacter fetidus TaxID=2700082 RepID=A0A6B2GZA5_9BACT|nr:ABC transporter ATP-binding protein [Pontibacter fetidus]NDK56319.1 ABC transporter ATP-binding protein [Pontibacter fetidus]
MSDTVIKVENLSKQYRLGELGTGTISHDLNRWWHKVRGKEDPYLKIGEVNDRSTKAISKYTWALRDINFEVKQGEVLGIIGKNGAGKSTLLKLLSRVTAPTTGTIKAKGRIASLLEVGTGFHEDLTGRENIFLNGAILGMTKSEIRTKFDEIVAFSGTERYIDTPVKRYSSGMRVRLAFAVAAHLDPEILIVDEVLAVGDTEFQKKAIGKMQDVSTKEGRTVLFVSHNMAAIYQLCNKGLLLSNGQSISEGPIEQVLDHYTTLTSTMVLESQIKGNLNIELLNIELYTNYTNKSSNEFLIGYPAEFKLKIQANHSAQNIEIGINFKNNFGELISHITSLDSGRTFSLNEGEVIEMVFNLTSIDFSPGLYWIDVFIMDNGILLHGIHDILSFSVLNSNKVKRPGGFPQHVKLFTEANWNIISLT